MVRFNKYSIIGIKILYLFLCIIVLNKMSVFEKTILWGSPLLVLIGQVGIIWFNNILFTESKLKELITSIIFTIIIYLSMFILMELIYLGFAVIVVEIVFINKRALLINSKSILKHHDTMFILSYLFPTVGFSMFHTFLRKEIYLLVIFLFGLLIIYQVSTFLNVLNSLDDVNGNISYLKKMFIYISLLGAILFSSSFIVLKDDGIEFILEYIIYSGLLAIFPLTICRLKRIKYQKEINKY